MATARGAREANPKLRLTVVGVVVISLFAALLARLWYLQVLDSPKLAELAKRNEVRIVCEPAPRGLIRDRNGTVLVDNVVTTALTVSRTFLRANEATLVPRLSALLGITADELRARVGDLRYSDLKPVPFAFDGEDGDLTEKLIYIKEHAEDFPGVEVATLATRTYPYERLASHLLGYVGPITAAELKRYQRPPDPADGEVDVTKACDGYQQVDEIGKSGLELAYESRLRGVPGVLALEVDRQGRVLDTQRIRLPEQGHDLMLTLDAGLQKEVEASLAQGLNAARRLRASKRDPSFLRAPAGAAVVTEVTSGAVLASASYPDLNPNDFIGGISRDRYQAYVDDPRKPLTNRALAGLYAPASTFKLATSIAALRTGVVTVGEKYNDVGKYRVEGRCSGDCEKQNAGGTPNGTVVLQSAISVSSDTYYYRIGDKLWQQQNALGLTPVQDAARALGLGSRTGTGMPGELGGRVDDPNVRKQLHEANATAFPEARWFAGDNMNMAIGQGGTIVTPLQLANQYGTFANGGTLYQSRLVARVLRPDGSVAEELGPVVRSQTPLPPEVKDPIAAGLRGVVASPFGTANEAFQGYGGIPVAGKTGTAQVTSQGDHDNALFTGYGPYVDPRYSVAVVLEQGGFGGKTAAPVARRIFEHLSGQAPREINVSEGGGTD